VFGSAVVKIDFGEIKLSVYWFMFGYINVKVILINLSCLDNLDENPFGSLITKMGLLSFPYDKVVYSNFSDCSF